MVRDRSTVEVVWREVRDGINSGLSRRFLRVEDLEKTLETGPVGLVRQCQSLKTTYSERTRARSVRVKKGVLTLEIKGIF